jgi:hypothetical protein
MGRGPSQGKLRRKVDNSQKHSPVTICLPPVPTGYATSNRIIVNLTIIIVNLTIIPNHTLFQPLAGSMFPKR